MLYCFDIKDHRCVIAPGIKSDRSSPLSPLSAASGRTRVVARRRDFHLGLKTLLTPTIRRDPHECRSESRVLYFTSSKRGEPNCCRLYNLPESPAYIPTAAINPDASIKTPGDKGIRGSLKKTTKYDKWSRREAQESVLRSGVSAVSSRHCTPQKRRMLESIPPRASRPITDSLAVARCRGLNERK